MKKQKIIFFLILTILIFLAFIRTFQHSYVIFSEENKQEKIVGYCPSMKDHIKEIFYEKDYSLIEFSSSSEVLEKLRNRKIDIGLIGRKAKENEINKMIKQEIIKSGYTLVSNKRLFFEKEQLKSINISTYMKEEDIGEIIDLFLNIDFEIKKKETLEEINKGKIILINWSDWSDDFELVVVNDKNKKLMDFRGIFIYNY